MIIEEGNIIEIGGKQATVCFKHEEENNKYICVAFTKPLKYELYKYKIENDKLMVAKLTNPKEAAKVMAIFVRQGVKENGIPKELESIFNKVE